MAGIFTADKSVSEQKKRAFSRPFVRNLASVFGQEYKSLTTHKTGATKPYKSSLKYAKLRTHHPLFWRNRRLRFLSASRLAHNRQASEQYA